MSDESNKKNAHGNLVHAGEFTKIENTAIVYVLRGWFAGLSGVPGALEAGDDAWANTTLFEHFVSKLNADATTRTKERGLAGTFEHDSRSGERGGRAHQRVDR